MQIVTHVRPLYYRLNGSFRKPTGETVKLKDVDGRLTLAEVSDTSPTFKPSEFVVIVNDRPEVLTVLPSSRWH